MRNIKNSLLLSTTIAVCIQFVTSNAQADALIPDYLMPRLYQAIDSGNFADVKAIVDNTRATALADKTSADYQVNLEFVDEDGNTPLIRAAAQGNVDVVKYFSQLGAKY